MRAVNRIASRRIRRGGGRVMGSNALVLSTIGAKSGLERSNPLACFHEVDGSWLVVASAGGARSNPGWYYNIGAHPDDVRIDIGDGPVAVEPRQLNGDERATAWRAITTMAPQFVRYEQATDRVIPVIRLTQHKS
jgi:deazaflavin-dependent oxidoreductase (nitroreductase family)